MYNPNILSNVILTQSDNLNNTLDSDKLYQISGAKVPLNAPVNDAYNACIWNYNFNQNKTIQFYASYNRENIYYRFRETSTWTPWFKLSATTA